MGTEWNKTPLQKWDSVQIPSCAGTVVMRKLFERIGGYDDGMILYGSAEPEFGIRCWLSDNEVVSIPDLTIWHRFKSETEITDFLHGLEAEMLHNALRFGFLYLTRPAYHEVVKWYAETEPKHIQEALRMVRDSDLRARREHLENTLRHDFNWFAERFNLRDHTGQEILTKTSFNQFNPARSGHASNASRGDVPCEF